MALNTYDKSSGGVHRILTFEGTKERIERGKHPRLQAGSTLGNEVRCICKRMRC